MWGACTIALVGVLAGYAPVNGIVLSDYTDHECIRPCVDGAPPMECVYNFTVEWYHTLTKACYNCPFNLMDCARPHCVAADGVERGIITINRQLPGPALHVCEGDTMIISVRNRLDMSEGTTIHWHGLHQRGTPYMDGVEMITQCPIPAHTTWEYKFKADTPGTHWYHAHSGLQRADGLFGCFVIRQPPAREPHNGLYDYDLPDHTFIITDWLAELAANKFTAHHHSDGDNKPKSMLMNGKGRFRIVTNTTSSETAWTPRAEFTVAPNKSYRFRLISSAILNCPIQVSIDQHNLTMIASDGGSFEPFEVESFNIFAGERFDFILKTDKAIHNYWIRIRGLADCGESHSKGNEAAILRYDGAPAGDPTGVPVPSYENNIRAGKLLNPLNYDGDEMNVPVVEMDAVHDDDITSRARPDVSHYLSMDFHKIDNDYFHDPELYPLNAIWKKKHLYSPQMNHITMMMPPALALYQSDEIPKELFCTKELLKNGSKCTEEFCECIHMVRFDKGLLLELILVDEGVTFDANHPIHLHGYAYRVVGMGRLNKSISVEEVKRLDAAGELPRKLSKAPLKDTVTVPDGGYTIIRFVADNPGMWLFHCHIAFHSQIGMTALIQVGAPSEFAPRPAGFPKCGGWRYTEDEKDVRASASEYRGSILFITLILLLIFRG